MKKIILIRIFFSLTTAGFLHAQSTTLCGDYIFNGNVDIGTTLLTNKLFVDEEAVVSQSLKLTNSLSSGTEPLNPDTYLRLMFSESNSYIDYGGNLRFRSNGNSDPIVTFTPDGNIGIGTTNPTSKLCINGETVINESLKVTNSLLFGTDPLNPAKRLKLMFTGTDSHIDYGGKLYYHSNDITKPVMVVDTDGNIGIGITDPQNKLDVNGVIRAKELRAEASNWADFVFDENYRLPDLKEVETHIKTHRHLPGIPSEAEIKEEGINIVEMQSKLLQKIEEMTLYMIRQQETIGQQQQHMEEMQKEIDRLKSENNE
ncbi:MAG: hypothetical protein LUG18_05895 [Candidatus Azobacteroides sp.]|nr:hypothetical protein [Candidatus Azobacteroides sp.]